MILMKTTEQKLNLILEQNTSLKMECSITYMNYITSSHNTDYSVSFVAGYKFYIIKS